MDRGRSHSAALGAMQASIARNRPKGAESPMLLNISTSARGAAAPSSAAHVARAAARPQQTPTLDS
jgi:hypothetical protein